MGRSLQSRAAPAAHPGEDPGERQPVSRAGGGRVDTTHAAHLLAWHPSAKENPSLHLPEPQCGANGLEAEELLCVLGLQGGE